MTDDVCDQPGCTYTNSIPQGLAMHKFRAHGIKKTEEEKKVANRMSQLKHRKSSTSTTTLTSAWEELWSDESDERIIVRGSDNHIYLMKRID